MKKHMLLALAAFCAFLTLAHATAMPAAAKGCGKDKLGNAIHCPHEEKKPRDSNSVPPTATFTSTPEPTATPTETSTPKPTPTTVAALVVPPPVPQSESSPVGPDPCLGWPAELLAGSALVLLAGPRLRSRAGGMQLFFAGRLPVSGSHALADRLGQAFNMSADGAGTGGAALAAGGAAGWALGLPCGFAVPAALIAVALGAGVGILSKSQRLPDGGAEGSDGTSSTHGAVGNREDSYVRARGFKVDIDGGSSTEPVDQGDFGHSETPEPVTDLAGEPRFTGNVFVPGPPPGGGADENVRYTMFLPDGTPSRSTAHVAVKNPSKASPRKNTTDSSSDGDGDGDSD